MFDGSGGELVNCVWGRGARLVACWLRKEANATARRLPH